MHAENNQVNMESQNMRMICEYPVGTLRNATTVANKTSVATVVKTMPGVGKPFLIYASLPSAATMADFSMFPQFVVSSVVSENLQMINDMLDMDDGAGNNPLLDALTF